MSCQQLIIQNIHKAEIEVIKQPIFEPFGNLFSKIRKKGIPKKNDQSIFDKFLIYLRGNLFIPDSRIFWVNSSVDFLSKYILENRPTVERVNLKRTKTRKKKN